MNNHRLRSRARLRALATAVLAGILATVTLATPAAATEPDPNWWYTGMHVPEAQAAGLTGAGVKIAVIDGQINPDLPLFAGARLAFGASNSCGADPVSQSLDEGSAHGTRVTALLLARASGPEPIQGIAPDAEVTFYPAGPASCQFSRSGPSPLMQSIALAVADGNRIISISQGQAYDSPEDQTVIADALARGVVIVTSSPNDASQVTAISPQGYNGVVSVAAVSRDGNLLFEEGTTVPVKTPSVAVVAPGIGIRLPASSVSWDGTSVREGTSYAAPLVAGSLALLLQKNPTATGNQLIQALIRSTSQAVKGVPRDTTDGYGYGAVSLTNLLATDPITLPDENPLMDKPLGVPTAEQVAAAGGAAPSSAVSTSPSAPSASDAPSATAADQSSDALLGVVPWLIGAGAVLLIAVVVLVIILASPGRHRR